MVAATETAPIERIPPQKDGGAENDRRSERPHGGPTASQPARQHHRCAACTAATPPLHSRTIAPPLRCRPKARGPQKSCSPRFAIICGRRDLCRAYARVCPSGPLPYRCAQKPWLRAPQGSQPFRCSFPNLHWPPPAWLQPKHGHSAAPPNTLGHRPDRRRWTHHPNQPREERGDTGCHT